MTIYVINLDRATERMARMQAMLEGRGLAFQRLAAVDGRALPQETLAEWSGRHADGSLILSPGEVGILLSQREAWSRIAADGVPGIVFEDDIHLAAGAEELLRDLAWLPADADIVKFETTGRKIAVSRQQYAVAPGIMLARLRTAHLGSAGYIVTPAAARRLLDVIQRIDRAVDHEIFDPVAPIFAQLVIYQTIPALCIQDQFIGHQKLGLGGEIERAWALEKKKRKVSTSQKIRRELRRLIEQADFAVKGSRLNPLSDRLNVKVRYPEPEE
ncbi:glycosyltransferase family 25 protein [Rhizobium sp. CSW-27]|uniref:glycosyltransferase family 25 protein n=1 Tax=Rhizobium sp. CSW-27 TaxID=2839985 RepID=UPI001C026AAA|nr:glycosyltransferase family 25 protein [Rhizobium sp. CSW-27]